MSHESTKVITQVLTPADAVCPVTKLRLIHHESSKEVVKVMTPDAHLTAGGGKPEKRMVTVAEEVSECEIEVEEEPPPRKTIYSKGRATSRSSISTALFAAGGDKTSRHLLDQDPQKISVLLSTDPSAQHLLADIMDKGLVDQYPFQASVYDAMMVAFTPVQSKTSSFFLILILLLNAFVQLYYCSIVYFAFVLPQGEFTQEHIDGYRTWRVNVAHNVENIDKLSQVSLASRVCDQAAHASLEFSTAQANAVEEITKYLNGFQGTGMTLVSVFCWLIFVADELRNIIAFALGIRALRTASTAMTVNESAFRIDAMSMKRKLLMCMVLTCRVIVSALLLVIGSYFLIYTRTVGDLILNAVALEMVQHMDRLVFRALAPTRVKKCLTMLQPLLLNREDVEHIPSDDDTRQQGPCLGIGRGALMTLFFSMLALGGFLPSILKEKSQREAALQEICPYDVQNLFEERAMQADTFVYGLDETGMLLWTGTPSFQEASTESAHRIHTVLDIINLGKLNITCELGGSDNHQSCMANSRKLPLVDNSLSSLVYNMKIPPETKLMQFHADDMNYHSATTDFQGCHDVARADGKHAEVTNTSVLRPWILGVLSNAVGSMITDCSQVEEYCLEDTLRGLRARMWCPETCGCHRPDSPNQVSIEYGCPAQCAMHPTYISIREQASCEDVGPGNDKWLSFQALAESIILLGNAHGAIYQSNSNKIVGGLMRFGCAFVAAGGFCSTDAEDGPKRAIKNMRYWCPVSCGCSGLVGALDCPSSCNGTQLSASPYFAKRLVYMPGLPATNAALPQTVTGYR
eukprot:TRINITY_DN4857_c0_g2_i1.p1 TRINITY_DN4857_c0_g2~~TRINITY_DN4857_c0_g2_i1.p1  ORF type:complete len:939 (+),score=123.23 TRINITY_DN4857_c0_g2_i1:407-2818(+)